MLIGYSRPASVAFSVSGTGAGFLSDIRLDSGNPADETQIRWISSSSPIGDYLDLRAVWATAQQVRVVCLIGLCQYLGAVGSPTTFTRQAFPDGVKIELTGRRYGESTYTYALGGNATTQRTVRLPDGTTACWFVLGTGLSDLIGLQARIYNDDDSATWAAFRDYITIGEFGIFKAASVGGKPGWSVSQNDPTERHRTLAAQLHTVERRTYRQAKFDLVPVTEAQTRGEGLDGSTDYELIEAALLRSKRCAFIPHYADSNGVFDGAILHREAIFGIATPHDMRHAGLRYYEHAYTVEELPPADA